MRDSKEKSENKFIKRIALFLAGALTALGIGHAVSRLPEGRGQAETEPSAVTDKLLEENNGFKESLKYDTDETLKSPIEVGKEQIKNQLEAKLGEAKDKQELEKLMLKDIKERYVKEYNKAYGTNYSYNDLSVYYSHQEYAYVKEGKFYGKEKVDGAQRLTNKIAYRIYNSQDEQLEAILVDYAGAYSSEDINILGKYKNAFEAIRSVNDNNTKEGISKMYIEGILKAYEKGLTQNVNGVKEDYTK